MSGRVVCSSDESAQAVEGAAEREDFREALIRPPPWSHTRKPRTAAARGNGSVSILERRIDETRRRPWKHRPLSAQRANLDWCRVQARPQVSHHFDMATLLRQVSLAVITPILGCVKSLGGVHLSVAKLFAVSFGILRFVPKRGGVAVHVFACMQVDDMMWGCPSSTETPTEESYRRFTPRCFCYQCGAACGRHSPGGGNRVGRSFCPGSTCWVWALRLVAPCCSQQAWLVERRHGPGGPRRVLSRSSAMSTARLLDTLSL